MAHVAGALHTIGIHSRPDANAGLLKMGGIDEAVVTASAVALDQAGLAILAAALAFGAREPDHVGGMFGEGDQFTGASSASAQAGRSA